jgi:flagellar motor protein MotB
MRPHVILRSLWALAVVVVAGCAQNPFVLEGKLADLRKDQQGLTARYDDAEKRVGSLDTDNQHLQSLLAQSQQQSRIYEDQARALQSQLKSVTEQLAKARDERSDARGSLAGGGSRPRATITANSSLQKNLPQFNIRGVEVRYDGDVVRVELPGGQLFESGQAKLRPEGTRIVEEVASELARAYPEQIIGVEGHTDPDPVHHSNQFTNNHQLATSRARAVYDHLTSRTRLRPAQLFVVGHGSNHPVVSNATPTGKERNRRVELVVYPEQMGR